jgi:hypothetical protein
VELDTKVNDFMKEKGRNMAVRNFMIVAPDGQMVIYQAMVFYDFPFNAPVKPAAPAMSYPGLKTEPAKPQVKTDRGALWEQKDGSITGKWNDEKISVPEEFVAQLRETGTCECSDHGMIVIVSRNPDKKEARHPDYFCSVKK